MVTIFQVITMEGWTDIMYMVDDTSSNVITVPYFCLIIIIGSFFLLNLILAVIMRVFTQNAELEKLKSRKRKILEETRKLRNNPKAYLTPLKITKIVRPKSASYRKKFEELEQVDGDIDSPLKFSSNKQTNSNFLPLQSLRKLNKSRAKAQSSNLDTPLKIVSGEGENKEVLGMFELRRSEESKDESSVVDPASSAGIGLLNAVKRDSKIDPNKVGDIKDKFALYMNSLRIRNSINAAKMYNKRTASFLSNSREEKEKLFNKILNLK